MDSIIVPEITLMAGMLKFFLPNIIFSISSGFFFTQEYKGKERSIYKVYNSAKVGVYTKWLPYSFFFLFY